MHKKRAISFERASCMVIIVLLAVLPWIFLPGTLASSTAVKGAILYSGVLLAAVLWLVASFIEGSIVYIRSKVFLLLTTMGVLAFVSALASPVVRVALGGRGFVIDSFTTIALSIVLAWLVAYFSKDKARLRKMLFTLFFSGGATLGIQFCILVLARLGALPQALSIVVQGGTVLGSWTDFALFVAFMCTFGMLMFELFAPKGFLKTINVTIVAIAIVLLICMNYALAWILLLVVALLLFIYKMSVERSISSADGRTTKNAPFPVVSFSVLVIGLFFVLTMSSIGAHLSHFVGIGFSDVRPSFGSSLHIARASLLHDPLFGVGSGRFANAWDLYHTPAINGSAFWNTSFDSGYNVVLTTLVTLGLLPTLVLIITIIWILAMGIRVIGRSFEDRTVRFIAITATTLSILIVAYALVSIPGIVSVALLFVLAGLVVGIATTHGMFPVKEFYFLRDPRTSFFAVTLMTVLILGGCTALYTTGKKFTSIVAYNRALGASDAATALRRIAYADALTHADIYYRTAAAIYTNKLSTESQGSAPDTAALQEDFSNAQASAQAAVSWDSTTALNWYTLAQVYQLAIGANKDAAATALQATMKAQTLNPQNPLFEVTLAQIAVAQKDSDNALFHLDRAIVLKQNYLDAYVFKAQIQQAGGDTPGAIETIKQYVSVMPYDATGYGILAGTYLGTKEYSLALDAASRAHALNPQDPRYDALYIRALYAHGDQTKADAELALFKTQFPDQAANIDALVKTATP